MTEKKQGVPVQEPVPAEEPAKAGDNNKIWHYNGKFPVVVDYLVFFGIFLLAQGLGTAVAWLAGCKWPDPELLASPDEAISTAEQIAADTERDNFLSAREALAYGLIDKIIDKR